MYFPLLPQYVIFLYTRFKFSLWNQWKNEVAVLLSIKYPFISSFVTSTPYIKWLSSIAETQWNISAHDMENNISS